MDWAEWNNRECAPEEILLEQQRRFNCRDQQRERKKQLTRAFRDAQKDTTRHPNPTFRMRFSAGGDAKAQFRVQAQLLKLGVASEQLEWPELSPRSQEAA